MSGKGESDTEPEEEAPRPPNFRRVWSEDEDRELRRLIAGREPPLRIARALQRTQDAVRGRAGQLGLVVPSPLRPWRIFAAAPCRKPD